MKNRNFGFCLFWAVIASLLLTAPTQADVDTKDGCMSITTSTDMDGFTANIAKADGQTVKSGGISDDFSGDLSNWTQDLNTWSIDTGKIKSNNDSNTALIHHNTCVGSINQWVKVEFDTRGAGGGFGILLRSQDASNGNDNRYIVYEYGENDEIYWSDFDWNTIVSDIQHDSLDLSDGSYLGVMITGTGNDTILYVFLNPAGDGPWAIGGADLTFTDNPTNAADHGEYVGLYSNNGGADFIRGDNFSAGSWTP